MILYVNGDSNSAGAEAVNQYAFANDDPLYWALGRQPHPDNLRASYGCELANLMGAILECDAESASSNQRILRTTWARLQDVQGMPVHKPDLVVIGWSTWEREEWWDAKTGRYWQVNAGGTGFDWPDEIKERYKNWIVNVDYPGAVTRAHDKIWELHNDLKAQGIRHYFFNCFEPFTNVSRVKWDDCYLEPYNPEFTYYNWLTTQGFKTVSADSYHFGHDAHCAWAEFLFQKLVEINLTQ